MAYDFRTTPETVVILRGCFQEQFFDENGVLQEEIALTPGCSVVTISAAKGQWHTGRALESGTVVMACKDGAWEPVTDEDILHV